MPGRSASTDLARLTGGRIDDVKRMRPPVACGSRSRTLGRFTVISPDPGLNLAFRHVPVTDNTAPARSLGQIGMGFNMGSNFRFNRLAKQLPGAGAQYLRQRIITGK